MKIKVAEGIEVGVAITETSRCPSGSAYYTIDYLIDGVCIHSATTGAIYGNPNPIAMLDRLYTWTEEHYQDVLNPDPVPEGDERKGRTISGGTVGSRHAWWEEFSQTHRQAIIKAAAQIV